MNNRTLREQKIVAEARSNEKIKIEEKVNKSVNEDNAFSFTT